MKPVLLLPPRVRRLDKCRNGIDGRIVQNHLGKLLLLVAHGGEADVLRADCLAAESAGVLLREESLGNDHEQIDVEKSTADGDGEREPLVAQHPAQRRVVLVMDPLKALSKKR